MRAGDGDAACEKVVKHTHNSLRFSADTCVGHTDTCHKADYIVRDVSSSLKRHVRNVSACLKRCGLVCAGDGDAACEKVVKRSLAEWRAEEEVVDDITCLVVYFNHTPAA